MELLRVEISYYRRLAGMSAEQLEGPDADEVQRTVYVAVRLPHPDDFGRAAELAITSCIGADIAECLGEWNALVRRVEHVRDPVVVMDYGECEL